MPEQSTISSMQEYYIRKEGDEDSRGPFTLDQLASLVEAGQVDRQTFYYDSLSEKWIEVQSNPELVAALFPTRKKLTMKPKEQVVTINAPKTEEEKPITVEEMLAAAEGETDETRSKRDPTGRRARAAMWSMRAMAAMCLVSASGLIILNMEVLMNFDLGAILANALLVWGLVDTGLGLILLLEATEIYPILRLRAAAGAGFFAFYFFADGHVALIPMAVAGSIGLFVGTFLTNMWAVLLVSLLGLAGMAGFAYTLLS